MDRAESRAPFLASVSGASMSIEKLEIGHNGNGAPIAKKLVIACPTYGPVDPRAAKSLRVAIMHAGANGISWVGDVSPDRMGWEAARNTAADAAIENGADGIMWVDSDMILPAFAITRLVQLGVDFASGMYFQRLPPYYPLVGKFNGENFSWVVEWPENVVFQADGIGFGCAYTSTKLLKDMMTLPEGEEKSWFRRTRYSEDLSFCVSAAKLGVKPHIDTAIMCGHLGDSVEVTVEHFKTANPYGLGLREGVKRPVVGVLSTQPDLADAATMASGG